MPAPGQRRGSLHSRCLSARNKGAQLWLVPSLQHSSFQTFCHRIFPNETSPLPVQLGSGHLELLSLSTTSFLSQHELPSTCPEFLHHVTSPTFQDTNYLPPLLSSLPSHSLVLSFSPYLLPSLSSFPNVLRAFTNGLGIVLAITVVTGSLSLWDAFSKRKD